MRQWLWLALLASSAPAAAQGCGGHGLALQVLGSGGPELLARRASSGYLVWIDSEARVLIDSGGGTALRFAESGARMTDLDVVLFTQLSADHTSDLPSLAQSAKLEPRARPLPLFGPPGNRLMPSTITFVRESFDTVRGTYRHLGDLIAPLDKSTYKLDPHDVRQPPAKIGAPRPRSPTPIPVFHNARVRISALPPSPPGAMPGLSYRIEANDKAIVIAADSSDDRDLVPLAGDADVLVMAHAVPEGTTAIGGSYYPQPSLIGRIANAAKVRQLVLTHRLSATQGREEETLVAIRKTYSGPVYFADDLSCYYPLQMTTTR
jgi:ribonuclease BN (tRNA processing enzyme)